MAQNTSYKNPTAQMTMPKEVVYNFTAVGTTVLPDLAAPVTAIRATFAAGLSVVRTLTLPPIGASAGCFVSVTLSDKSTASSLTVKNEAGATLKAGIDADGDTVLLFCTGHAWELVFDGVAA